MPTKKVPCVACDGDGEEYWSCCGDDVKGTPAEDYGLCPTCYEHLGGERSPCEICGGSGEVDEEVEDTSN